MLYEAIAKPDATEKFQLAEQLLDSVASETFAARRGPAQRTELCARLAKHRARPDEPTVTLAEILIKASIK